MKEYMTSLGTVLMMTALSSMLVPEGNIKKFVSMAMGFILISAALSFIPSGKEDFKFSFDSFELNQSDFARAESAYRAEIIKEHRKNLESKIESYMKHGSKAYVEVTESGEITRVTLTLRGDESRAVRFITEELGVNRERIKLKYDKN